MRKFFRIDPSLMPRVGDVVVDAPLVIGTMVTAWFWVQDHIAKVNVEFGLMLSNAFAVYFYYRHIRDMPVASLKTWALFVPISAGMVALSSGFDRRWWDFTVAFVGGHQDRAMRILDTHPPSNFFMIVSVSCMYMALFNLVRLPLRWLLKALYPGLPMRESSRA